MMYVDTMREEFVAQVGEATRQMEEEGTPDERKARREIANFNERRRMKNINSGFDQLRGLLPVVNDRVSKAAILQHASEYITFLQERTRQQHLEIMQLRGAGVTAQSSRPVVTSMADSSQIMVQLQTQVGSCHSVQGMVPISVHNGQVAPIKPNQQLVHAPMYTMNRIGQHQQFGIHQAPSGNSIASGSQQSWQGPPVLATPTSASGSFFGANNVPRQGATHKKKRTPAVSIKGSTCRKHAAGKKERRATTPTGFSVKAKTDNAPKNDAVSLTSSPNMSESTSQKSPQQNLAVMLAAIATLESGSSPAPEEIIDGNSTPILASSTFQPCSAAPGAGDIATNNFKAQVWQSATGNPAHPVVSSPRQLISRRLLLSPTQR